MTSIETTQAPLCSYITKHRDGTEGHCNYLSVSNGLCKNHCRTGTSRKKYTDEERRQATLKNVKAYNARKKAAAAAGDEKAIASIKKHNEYVRLARLAKTACQVPSVNESPTVSPQPPDQPEHHQQNSTARDELPELVQHLDEIKL